MKYEKKEAEFRPVTITLETQEEVDVLHSLVGVAGGGFANGFLYKLYDALSKDSISVPRDYWSGQLTPRP
jgi:hypothetical protein